VLESLSSWLSRLAACYEIRVEHLLDNLGPIGMVPADVSHAPPMAMLAVLSERTGVELARLQAMTLQGWVPWLFDALDVNLHQMQPMFDSYVRDNSVLLAPGEAGTSAVLYRYRRWPGPWFPQHAPLSACPVCASDPDRGKALVWRLVLMTGCVEHGVRLENSATLAISCALDRPHPAPIALTGPLALVDGYTHQALTTGRVDLPGHSVHAGVYFRLLRSLIDELSMSPSGLTKAGSYALHRVWNEAGCEERAGLSVWRPYESMDSDMQEKLRGCAGVALRLAAEGEIIARGRHASAIAPRPHRPVYSGHAPTPVSMARPTDRDDLAGSFREAQRELAAEIVAARTDAAAARRLLEVFTSFARTPASVEAERRYLMGLGIPGRLLPGFDELEHDRA
jgi:hypothetical protein